MTTDPTIRCADNGWLVAGCLCGGEIRVNPRTGDTGLNVAMAQHVASLLHKKARLVWELGRDSGLHQSVGAVR